MRVAVVTQYFPTSVQQWAGHSAYQTLRLLANMCELEVFYPEARYPAALMPAAKRAAAKLDHAWQPAGVNVTYVPYPVLPVVSRPLNGYAMEWRLLPHVRRFRPDVILNYVVYPDGWAAVRIGGALGVPVVLTAIGSDLNRISDPLCGVLTRAALRRAQIVTTVSHDLGQTAIRLGAPPMRVRPILNGCDTTVFFPRDRAAARSELSVPGTERLIVYIGRLDVRKGLLELLDAMAGLPDARCVIVGDGPDRGLLVERLTALGLVSRVELEPSCPTGRVALWMGAADLVTLPSYKEGCPNVVVEALAAGRPVVATNVGGIPELMDASCGQLVPPMDVPALRLALKEVLGTEWDAEAISARRSRSWQDVAADLYAVLQDVTGAGGKHFAGS